MFSLLYCRGSHLELICFLPTLPLLHSLSTLAFIIRATSTFDRATYTLATMSLSFWIWKNLPPLDLTSGLTAAHTIMDKLDRRYCFELIPLRQLDGVAGANRVNSGEPAWLVDEHSDLLGILQISLDLAYQE